jgi:hypothetical protein
LDIFECWLTSDCGWLDIGIRHDETKAEGQVDPDADSTWMQWSSMLQMLAMPMDVSNEDIFRISRKDAWNCAEAQTGGEESCHA